MVSQEKLLEAAAHPLLRVDVPELGERTEGKVRDIYVVAGKGQRVLVATDRVSAFDRVLGTIPLRGQVLNQLSAWWFEQLQDVVGNHVVGVPDPNVTIAREAEPLPVEVVVRGFITGVTPTALWTLYRQGVERPYGLVLPVGLAKNDPLPEPVITPTTKAPKGEHDQRLTPDEVVEGGYVEPELWASVRKAALTIFARGQEIARNAGLLLVDTKYEFGLLHGELVLIDEVHTPDSSRFWEAKSYQETRGTDHEPEHQDKEFLRLWYVKQGYCGEGEPPEMPDEVRAQLARRYIGVYERLTGREFVPGELPADERIRAALLGAFG